VWEVSDDEMRLLRDVVDDTVDGGGKPRKRSSGAGMGSSSLSRHVTREDQEDPLGNAVATVEE